MTLAERIQEQVDALPDPLKREVLDFAAFLNEWGAWRDLVGAQGSALAAVWDNAEDAVWHDV